MVVESRDRSTSFLDSSAGVGPESAERCSTHLIARPPLGRAGAVPTAATGLSVDVRRFSWMSRLGTDYLHDFQRLSHFYNGNPAGSRGLARRHRAGAAPSAAAERGGRRHRGATTPSQRPVQRRHRASSSCVIHRPWRWSPASRRALRWPALYAAEDDYRRPPGGACPRNPPCAGRGHLLGRRGRSRLGRSAVVHGVRPASRAHRASRCRRRPTALARWAATTLDTTIEAALADLKAALPATEFTPRLLDDLARIYRPGRAA